MIKGITKSGFLFEVDENALNDMELVDVLADDTMDDGFRMSHVVRKLLGDQQRRALYDHVRTEDGRVPVDAVVAEVEDIFASYNQPGKNS